MAIHSKASDYPFEYFFEKTTSTEVDVLPKRETLRQGKSSESAECCDATSDASPGRSGLGAVSSSSTAQHSELLQDSGSSTDSEQ